jgi:hypothetical protein
MFSKALLISSLCSVAFATLLVTEPIATTTYHGGTGGAVVTWQDNGTAPLLSAYGSSTISIYVGNAKQQTPLQLLSTVDVSTTSTVTFTPDATIGPNGNEYFIRIQSVSGQDSTGTPLQAFSAKFSLDTMTGTFNASVQAEISGQTTAPLASQTASGSSGTTGATSATSTPSGTASTGSSKRPTGTSSTSSSTASATSGAMGLKAGWAGMVFGAVVGVTMF